MPRLRIHPFSTTGSVWRGWSSPVRSGRPSRLVNLPPTSTPRMTTNYAIRQTSTRAMYFRLELIGKVITFSSFICFCCIKANHPLAYVPPEQPFALDHASRMDHWDMESAPSHAPPPVAFSGEDLPDFAFQAFSSNNETSLQELNQPSSQPQTSTIIHIDPTINTYVASPYTGSVLGPTISRSQNARSLSINASSLPRPPITSTHATWDAGATANKRQRLAAPRHKTTSTKVTCMFCQQGGVKV